MSEVFKKQAYYNFDSLNSINNEENLKTIILAQKYFHSFHLPFELIEFE